MLIPHVRKTWAPKGQTPFVYHLYKQNKVSAISAVAVSPKQRRVSLYIQFRGRNLNGLDVRDFLQHLLTHRRGNVVLLWDRATIHRRREVKEFLGDRPRVEVEPFPAYAPELNPAEFVWAQADRALANSAAQDLGEMRGKLWNSVQRMRRSQRLLWSCIYASDLPWP